MKERQYIAPMDYSIIKERRFLLGLTQQGSGRLCGVEPAHYQEYRGGKSKSFRRDALEDRRGTRTGVAVESKGSG